MPSALHEALVELFRARPTLAPELLTAACGLELPSYGEARVETASFADLNPATLRADLVVLLEDGVPVLGIVVEVQLASDEAKRESWPAYAVMLRARWHCPTVVLVVTPHEAVAAWAREPIALGGGNVFVATVLGPDRVPVVTDRAQAAAAPELAVLSAMAHGHSADAHDVAVTALAGVASLPAAAAALYYDLIMGALAAATRHALEEAMDLSKYEFSTEFAKRHLAIGREEGRQQGRQEGARALREAVVALASVLGLPLDAPRRQALAAVEVEELERLVAHLREHRAWPADLGGSSEG